MLEKINELRDELEHRINKAVSALYDLFQSAKGLALLANVLRHPIKCLLHAKERTALIINLELASHYGVENWREKELEYILKARKNAKSLMRLGLLNPKVEDSLKKFIDEAASLE